MEIKIVSKGGHKLDFQTEGAAGMDIQAFVEEDVVLHPGERKIIPTGLYVQLPQGTELQIRSRSGLAMRGIIVYNAPATIDCDYRGEIGVLLYNGSNIDFVIKNGNRIAQGVLARYMKVERVYVDSLDETDRGNLGWGSTKI